MLLKFLPLRTLSLLTAQFLISLRECGGFLAQSQQTALGLLSLGNRQIHRLKIAINGGCVRLNLLRSRFHILSQSVHLRRLFRGRPARVLCRLLHLGKGVLIIS